MSGRAKQETRKNLKKGIDKDDSRRKREEQANGLRKNKREESLQKRRNLAASTDALEDTSAPSISSQTANDRHKLADLVAGLTCDDPLYILDCATRIRKLLSVKTNPPIDSVVQAGAVPRLINLLGLVSQPQIQFEACWALTNIASGSLDQTMAVVNANAVPMFVRLLEVPSSEVREQALWALANIAGENASLRDLVISHGAVELVIAQFTTNPPPSISMIRNATWAISNFSRGLPVPPKEVALRLLPVIAHLIKHNDEAVASDASWACSYLSEDGAPAAIARIIECPGLLPALINNLLHPSAGVVTPSLRTLGNVVTGDESQTQIALDAGLCTALSQILTSKKRTIRKETCWALSNVTAGNARQIQAVLDAPGCVEQLIELFQNDEHDVRKECCWLFANITCGGTTKQIRDVVRAGVIEPFCQHLQKAAKNDPKIAVLIMQSLNNILKIGEKDNKSSSKCEARSSSYSNPYAEKIEEFGGLDTIESLQTHTDAQVYQLAVHLIEGYFLQDDEDEIENATPNTNNASTAATKGGFTFGIPPGGFPGAANMTFSF